ncbi:MAG: hypothetical protein NTU41_09840, partial [Chloroflexi bacterium]|nr:hypothetical protein [Chloroflexota bacterium]
MVAYGVTHESPLGRQTGASRPLPFVQYALFAGIASLLCGFIVGLSIGMANGDVWLYVGVTSIVMMEGLAAGLLTLFAVSHLMARCAWRGHGVWHTACLSYLPYAVGGASAAAFGLFVGLVIPSGGYPLGWWQSSVIALLAILLWTLLGMAANRLQDREERVGRYLRGLEEEIVRRSVAEEALRKARDDLERRVKQRTAEL